MSTSDPVSAVVDPIANAMDPYVRRATASLFSPRTQNVVVKLIVALFAVTAMIGAAVVAYAGFYYFYVPKIAHSAPVYLDFSNNGNPTAHVDFGLTDNRQLLSYDQDYDVTIDMFLPNSDRNYEIGNFMVKVDLVADDGTIVHSSSRPAILKFQSPMLRIASTAARLIFLIVGWTSEAQEINLSLMEGINDSYNHPVSHAVVTLSDPRVMLYSMSMHIRAHFKGLRYLMYYWSVPTGIVFVGTFVLWSLLFAAIAWRSLAQWWSTRAANAYETAMSFGEDEEYSTLEHNTQMTATASAPSDYEGEPSRPTDAPSTDGEQHSLSVPQDRDTEAEDQIVPTWTSHRSESRSSFDVVDEDDDTQGDKNATGDDFPGLRRRQV
ncbi:putative adipose-regulatory protein-domain-containing protein [Syncephalis plumigaleata]|nr:putative adipose-regulatory protein-domain-containing protein [Syncephalis plumigaleata]